MKLIENIGELNEETLESLYYDIANCAYIEAQLMGEDEENARHTVADICQKGNRDRADSVIHLALAELQMPLGIAATNPHAREYIIDCVLADWLGIAKPAAAERWQVRAISALSLAHRWHGPFIRRLSPI